MKWSKLSMTEKNEVIKMAVAQGIKDISSIKNLYEESVNGSRRFEDGGNLFQNGGYTKTYIDGRGKEVVFTRFPNETDEQYETRYAERAAIRERNAATNKARYERRRAANEAGAARLNRAINTVTDAMEEQAKAAPFTGQEIQQAAEEQRQEKLDKWEDYKKGINATVTAAELGLSGASLLGAYANWKNWATATNATKRGIANLLQKAQLPMQVTGTAIDGYQTYDANSRGDDFGTYYNGASNALGVAGSLGAADLFNPKVDRVLDVLGIIQNSGDFLKFGYDNLFGGSHSYGGYLYAGGGNKNTPRTTGGAGYVPPVENINDILENVSGDIMEGIRKFAYPKAKVIDKNKGKGYNGGTAQRTYLLPRHIQKDIFLRDGYIEGREGDYGLVKKAVGNRNIPVFQTAKDAITRDNLVPFSLGYRGQSNFEDKFIDENKELVHAGGYPYALYIDGTNGNIYYKAWDLNDYTEDSGRLGQKGSLDRKIKSIGTKILDAVGSPTVVTTGIQPVTKLGPYFDYNRANVNLQDLFQDYNKELDIKDYPSHIGADLDAFMEGKGLHREKINNKYVYTLPEITVYGNKKAEGGPIHIDPSKRGTFTAAATKHGMGVQEFASKVLAHPENYSLTMRKKANFARNASHWKH